MHQRETRNQHHLYTWESRLTYTLFANVEIIITFKLKYVTHTLQHQKKKNHLVQNQQQEKEKKEEKTNNQKQFYNIQHGYLTRSEIKHWCFIWSLLSVLMIYTFNVHKRNITRYTQNKLDTKNPIKTNKKGNKKITGSLLLTNLNSILSFVAELGLLGLNINLSKVCTKTKKNNQCNQVPKFDDKIENPERKSSEKYKV